MSNQVNVKLSPQGTIWTIKDVNFAWTVAEFKNHVAKETEIHASVQRLVWRGHVLKDGRTLSDYGVQHAQTILLVRGRRKKRTASASPTGAASQPNAPAQPLAQFPPPPPPPLAEPLAQSSQSQSQSQSSQQASPAPNAFAGIFGAMNNGTANANPRGMFGMQNMQGMQQMLAQNPELMQQMMNSPMMRQLEQNPEMMRQLMLSNPQMQRLIEQNPELAHVLNNPDVIRQSLRMARNPALMQEMMRNNDRALSNIESLPGGFNALRRMYHDVQEPMMDALRSNPNAARSSDGSTDANESDNAPSGPDPNDMPLPNPWGSSSQSRPSNGRESTANPMALPFGMPGIWPRDGTGSNNMSPNPFAAMGSGMGNAPANRMAMMQQLMQNPAIRQMAANMMQQFAQNPQAMQQMLAANPATRQMMQSNPMMAQMMSNPQFLQAMADPRVLDASLRGGAAGLGNPLSMNLVSMGGGVRATNANDPESSSSNPSGSSSSSASGTGTDSATTTGATAALVSSLVDSPESMQQQQQQQQQQQRQEEERPQQPQQPQQQQGMFNPFLGMMMGQPPPQNNGGVNTGASPMNPFAMFNPFHMAAQQQQPQQQPQQQQLSAEQLYASQLQELQDMGFPNRQQNLHALVQTGGNLSAAVERLLR